MHHANGVVWEAVSPLGAESLDRIIRLAISRRRLSRFTLQLNASGDPSANTSHSSYPFAAGFARSNKNRHRLLLNATNVSKTLRGLAAATASAKLSLAPLTMVLRSASGGTRLSGYAWTMIRRSALPEEELTSSVTSLETLSRVCSSNPPRVGAP